MDGFLLVVRCCCDDIPVGLFSTLVEAEQAAGSMTRSVLASTAKAAGFPDDAVPLDCSPVQVVEFRGGEPVGSVSIGIVATDAHSSAAEERAEVSRLTPSVSRTLQAVRSDTPFETLLLAFADAVQFDSAEIGEDASDWASDVRKLVHRCRAHRSAE
jgi:hypothetical protein